MNADKYFTLVAQGIGLPHIDTTHVVGLDPPNVNSWLFNDPVTLADTY